MRNIMLPVINTPSYELELPSNNKKVKYRPFLMPENKLMLQAKEEKDSKQQYNTIRKIIQQCTFGEIKHDTALSPVDVEYIYLKLVIVSKGSKSNIGLTCQNIIERPARNHPSLGPIPASKGKCGRVNEIEIDLEKVLVNDKPKNTIMLSGDIGIRLNMLVVDENIVDEDNTDMMEFIIQHIDCIFNSENVYPAADSSHDELVSFLDQLNEEQFVRIIDFFRNLPVIKMEVEYKCESCDNNEKKELRGLQALFM